MSRDRLAVAALVAFALCVLLLPWYALDEYVASGWQATWLARLALIAAVGAAALLLALPRDGGAARLAAALSLAALVFVAVRAAVPPDFGFDFGGLEVPVERRFGLWVALGMAAGSLVALAPAALGG